MKETFIKGTVSEFIAAQSKEVEMTGAVLLYFDKKGETGIRMANMNPVKIAWMIFVLQRYLNKDLDKNELMSKVPVSPTDPN